MKVIQAGTEYALEGFGAEQTVKFTHKTEAGVFLDGTTNEEVVNMLIERFYHLNSKNFSPENSTIIIQLKSVRSLLKKRINKKIKRSGSLDESKSYTDSSQ